MRTGSLRTRVTRPRSWRAGRRRSPVCAVRSQRRDCADEEARSTEGGGEVGGTEIENRAARRHGVPGDRGDAKEDAAQQVDQWLPPPAWAARRPQAATRRGRVGDHARDQEADRPERVWPPHKPVVLRVRDRGVERAKRGRVEEERPCRLNDGGP